MRISDWSSDVCSSDLVRQATHCAPIPRTPISAIARACCSILRSLLSHGPACRPGTCAPLERTFRPKPIRPPPVQHDEEPFGHGHDCVQLVTDQMIGRASCSEGGCEAVCMSEVAGSYKKKDMKKEYMY